MIAIIDYGMGNIHSVKKALETMRAETVVTSDPALVNKADKVVFPGQGAFGDAVAQLDKEGLGEAIKEHIAKKKIYLGICLGMQILFESSQESDGVNGFGILKGKVVKFSDMGQLKVPHMGWNQLKKTAGQCPILRDVADNSNVYFCHSYYPDPASNSLIAASTDYGSDFASIIWQDNVYGVQFHPEKSQSVGLRILQNFVAL